MKGVGRITAALGAGIAALGGAAIFLHPRSGGRNRKATAAVARRQSANVATIVGASRRGGRNDAQLGDRVRSQLGERHSGAADAMSVTVHKGTVTLRGEVSHLDDIDALEETARSVVGVTDVNNLLRLPITVPSGR
jgi:osmotically-inducible protein OsmY